MGKKNEEGCKFHRVCYMVYIISGNNIDFYFVKRRTSIQIQLLYISTLLEYVNKLWTNVNKSLLKETGCFESIYQFWTLK